MQFDQVSGLIDRIYAAAIQDEDWNVVLSDIADTAHCANAALVTVDTHANTSFVLTPRADPEFTETYARYWWSKDPTVTATQNADVGRITTLDDTGRSVFLRSEFHNEFWKHSGLGAERAAVNLVVAPGMFSSFVLQARESNDDISNDAMNLLAEIVPHLIRAAHIQKTMRLMQYGEHLTELGADHRGRGVLILDRAARVIASDPIADNIIREREEISLKNDRLTLTHPQDTLRLHQLIQWVGETVQASCMELSGAEGVMEIQVLPYRHRPAFNTLSQLSPHAVVLMRDQETLYAHWLGVLQDKYDLTPAEGKVAIEIVRGSGSQQAAKRLNISVSTVRTHLAHIFQKTGVSRQSELVARLASDGISLSG